MWFNPKILYLNARIFGTVSGSPGLISNCYWTCVLFLCVVAGKMNNMLVV